MLNPAPPIGTGMDARGLERKQAVVAAALERHGPQRDVRGGLQAMGGLEIVALAGLGGSGAAEILQAIFGALPRVAGTVRIAGEELSPASPRAAT